MKLTTKIIADKVIAVTGCDIRSKSRLQEFVIARVMYSKLCSDLLTTNLTKVGEEINRIHCSVIHYKKLYVQPNYFAPYNELTYQLILSDLKTEFNLDVIIDPTKENSLLKQFKEKDKSYTQLLLKYNQLKIELKDSREDNQRLIEKNLKLSLNI